MRGIKPLANGTFSKVEITTHIKEDADNLYNSAKDNGYKVYFQYLPNQDPAVVRDLILASLAEAHGLEFIQNIKLSK